VDLGLSSPLVQKARAELYRLHWRMRSARPQLDLWEALRLLNESERWPRPRIDELRDKKLRELVAAMHARSPHYRKLMDERGVAPADVRGVADIVKLPIMTKAILRESAAALRVPGFADGALEMGITGGTTGQPMRVPRDLAGTPWMRASYWRGFGWGGLRLGEPWVQLFGGSLGHGARPYNKLKNWFAGKVFLPAFELGEGNIGAYVDAVKRAGARFLVGYASACNQLAFFVEKAGLDLRFDAVFPTAELLLDDWGERIGRVFRGKVMPYYGCGEIQSLGYTCPDVPGTYHTCDEHSILEVEGPDGHARLQGEGAFLITDLDNHAMPLIRYKNGDAGQIAAPGCACGRTLGRITRLDGRVNDVLVTTAGAAISGVIGTHVFRLIGNVDAYQIVQRRPGHAVIRIVRAPAYDAAKEEPKVRTMFGNHLGAGSEIEIEYLTDLPKTAAGKSRFVINEYLAAKAAAEAAASK
jgi:phenylacetate-CoA ligase